MSILPPQPPALTSEPVAKVGVTDMLSRAAERNLSVAMSLRATAWQLTEAGLRTFRPELSEVEVQDEVRALFRRSGG